MLKQCIYLLLGCCLALLFSGCLRTRTHITILSDGSADVEYVMTVNRDTLEQMENSRSAAKSASSEPLPGPGQIAEQMSKSLEAEVTKAGMTIAPYQEGVEEGVKISRHVRDLKEAKTALEEMQKAGDKSNLWAIQRSPIW